MELVLWMSFLFLFCTPIFFMFWKFILQGVEKKGEGEERKEERKRKGESEEKKDGGERQSREHASGSFLHSLHHPNACSSWHWVRLGWSLELRIQSSSHNWETELSVIEPLPLSLCVCSISCKLESGAKTGTQIWTLKLGTLGKTPAPRSFLSVLCKWFFKNIIPLFS